MCQRLANNTMQYCSRTSVIKETNQKQINKTDHRNYNTFQGTNIHITDLIAITTLPI